VIVVTGGAGFIGSCIVSRLNANGYDDIIIVDHLDDQGLKSRNLEGKKYAAYFDKAVFLQHLLGAGIDQKIDGIIHMGACSSTTGTDEHYYETNNFLYSRHLAEWCLKNNARYIYASSAATYGDGSCGYDDTDDLLKHLQPLNLYGWSKHKFDLWVLEKNLQDRLTGLKFFNVFGPNEYHKGDMRSVVNKAYPRAVAEGKISLFKSYHTDYSDGGQKRDFIYIKDAVDVVMFFLEHPEACGIYNVGTGQARSWNDLALALFSAIGKQPDIGYIDMPENLRSKYQYFTEASIQKLRSAGFSKPFTALEDAVKDYVKYLSTGAYL
jgi:ADP-L-glycero-D-manno-heptose 6-epimerase